MAKFLSKVKIYLLLLLFFLEEIEDLIGQF